MPRKAAKDVTPPSPDEEKKVAKPRKAKAAAPAPTFDIFSNATRKAVAAELLAKAGVADAFKSAADIKAEYLPVKHMLMELLFRRRGIPQNTVVELIGKENLGKSSLILWLLFGFIENNCPCLYYNSEPKMLQSDWMQRIAHTDPERASMIVGALDVVSGVAESKSLVAMDTYIRKWVDAQRESGVPMNVPLVVAVDTVTKLLPPEEAVALLESADTTTATTGKGMANASEKIATVAKWLHKWTRSISSFLEAKNVTLLLVSGQNTHIPTMGHAIGAARNKTRIGGEAINQTASTQITLVFKGTLAKDTPNGRMLYGDSLSLSVPKAGYGPKYTSVDYEIHFNGFTDAGGKLDSVFNMDEPFCKMLADNGVMGITCSRKLYTWEEYGLTRVRASTLYNTIISDPELKVKVGAALKINGYDQFSDTEGSE